MKRCAPQTARVSLFRQKCGARVSNCRRRFGPELIGARALLLRGHRGRRWACGQRQLQQTGKRRVVPLSLDLSAARRQLSLGAQPHLCSVRSSMRSARRCRRDARFSRERGRGS